MIIDIYIQPYRIIDKYIIKIKLVKVLTFKNISLIFIKKKMVS